MESALEQKSLKSQMKQANRLKARFVLIVGEEELAAQKVILREMDKSTQEEVASNKIVKYVESKWEE